MLSGPCHLSSLFLTFILIVPDDANESRTTPVDSGRLRHLPGTPVHLGHCTSEVNWDMYTHGGTTHKLRLQSHPLIPQSFPVRRQAPRQLQSGLRSAPAHPSFISSPSSNSI